MSSLNKTVPFQVFQVVSFARINFDFAIDDVNRLLKLHDAETKRERGRPSRQVEVFKRAGVILSVTAWESFFEDTIRGCAERYIQAAVSPTDVQKLFNSVAQAWLQESPKPPELAKWTADGWKPFLRTKLDADLQALNTPNTENLKALSKRYLEIDITAHWSWKRTSAVDAATRLDKLIRLRGELAHRGPDLFKGASVHRKQVVDAVLLLKNLVECTERAIDTALRSGTTRAK
jgi:RiboL-PSP-HEPN